MSYERDKRDINAPKYIDVTRYNIDVRAYKSAPIYWRVTSLYIWGAHVYILCRAAPKYRRDLNL